jgi:hypothetical protein
LTKKKRKKKESDFINGFIKYSFDLYKNKFLTYTLNILQNFNTVPMKGKEKKDEKGEIFCILK